MSQVDNRQKSGGRTYSSQNGSKRSTPGTGRRTSQSYRTNSSYQQRRGKKRKRGPQYDITKILLGIILAVASVICIMAAVKFIGSHKAKETEVGTTTVSETDLQKEVKVDGITLTGLSREEAREALDKQYQWGMKVTYKDEEYKLKNLMDSKVEALLKEIYEGEPKESYTLDTDGLEEDVQAEVKAIAEKWDVAAKNGSISGFDDNTGKFIYSGEKNGFAIDQDKLTADILAQLKAKNFQADVPASGNETAPKITEAQAKEMYKVIGTYTTTTTTNKDRNKNIELASNALNGLILQPGEEFSFNKATGERSSAKGYRPAGAYLNGELIEEPGGGVCQVSSTLYNAVVFSGLTTTERHAHSYEPSYVTPGEDAMVSFGGPDMKFVNNSSTAIAIRTSFADRKLKISIVGIPILEDGVTLSMTSKKTAELDAPAPVYEEDQTLQTGEEKIAKAETKGSRWVTNLVTKKDGVVVSDEFFHNSTYRGKSATIKRNTSGVVIPAADPSGTGSESGAGNSAETGTPPANETTTASADAQGPADKPATGETQAGQTQGPSSTTEAADGSGQNIVPPNPLNQ
ncbi:VanW family protein [Clostridium sp. Marseille-P2415]|uniref:VanW family protein n=1 Tax=Clostridium sp. Marseille-P2415 TaxID=1805471 RepID=UPI00098866C6|nr:VanW family protein [Clostridium sp. Marseille-P2415]